MPSSRSADHITLLPAPEGAASADVISTREQRQIRKEMCDYLRSDLYKRTGSGETSALWTSPLGWGVEYGLNRDGETLWARIYYPDGRLLAEELRADIYWLEAVLP